MYGPIRYRNAEVELPQGFEHWNRAMRGAYLKGRSAFDAGAMLADCPYQDHRKPSGKLSWSRAFIRAWQDGWRDAEKFSNNKAQLHC